MKIRQPLLIAKKINKKLIIDRQKKQNWLYLAMIGN